MCPGVFGKLTKTNKSVDFSTPTTEDVSQCFDGAQCVIVSGRLKGLQLSFESCL